MKRNAFSLIELIFVVILIGVLTGIGFYYSRPDYTRQDAQYTLLKLKEARYRAIGYDGIQSANCVTVNETFLEDDNGTSKHDIKSNITSTYPTICFDALGQPRQADNTRIHNNFNITFSSNNGKETNITLYSGTGYAIIPCNN